MEKKQILKEQEKQYFFDIPKDKNGEEIRLGEIFTTPLYKREKFIVRGFEILYNTLYVLGISTRDEIMAHQSLPANIKIIKPDTWGRIISDARLGSYDYLEKYPEAKEVFSTKGSVCKMDNHLLERCKKLECQNTPDCEKKEEQHEADSISQHDSWECIADELEAAEDWCDQNGLNYTGIVSISTHRLHEWSDRIRKLAKKGE